MFYFYISICLISPILPLCLQNFKCLLSGSLKKKSLPLPVLEHRTCDFPSQHADCELHARHCWTHLLWEECTGVSEHFLNHRRKQVLCLGSFKLRRVGLPNSSPRHLDIKYIYKAMWYETLCSVFWSWETGSSSCLNGPILWEEVTSYHMIKS